AGAAEFITKPWQNDSLLQTIRTILALREPEAETDPAALSRRQLDKQYELRNIVGQDARLLQVLRNVGQVAATDASVLIE
ncbi:hypothetical protein RYX56_25065, partial [Alkalihalophilus lindianensis]|nr:hypothetical protein [Alkalihalophilus lindianensis]